MAVTVHQISIQKVGGHNLMTPVAWANLDSADRVELVMRRKVQFLDEEGDTIPVKEALTSLKDAA